MRYEILHLKDFFPALGENGRDATLAAYLPDNLTEMGRDNEAHPSPAKATTVATVLWRRAYWRPRAQR